MTALEADEELKVVVFDSAVEGFFLNHSDFLAKLEDLTGMPQGPTGLEAWPDILVRLTRAPVVSIAADPRAGDGKRKRDRAGLRHEFREPRKGHSVAVGSGRRLGRRRRTHGAPASADRQATCPGGAAESDDIGGDLAEAYGYVNRSLPDAELDGFVDALATRIASFDKWAIANTKRLVNAASLPPDVEIAAGWDACMASIARPAAQERIKTLVRAGAFTSPETQKIGWDPTWGDLAAERLAGRSGASPGLGSHAP